MIKQIRTYGAVLRTPCADYLVVDVVDIADGGAGQASLYAIVTDIETVCIDEQDCVFHKTPFSIIVSGTWSLEFRNDTPAVINIWQKKSDKEVMSFEGVLTKEEWQALFDREESSLNDEDTESN